MLVLDSGGVSKLAERSRQAAALILALREQNLWPPAIPSIVLVECLRGHAGLDAMANRWRGERLYFGGKPAEAPPSMRWSLPRRNPVEPYSRQISAI